MYIGICPKPRADIHIWHYLEDELVQTLKRLDFLKKMVNDKEWEKREKIIERLG